MTTVYKVIILVLFIAVGNPNAFTQAPERPTSADLHDAIKRLNVLGSALYVAAHPDDENTRLISWLSNHLKMHTGYLSPAEMVDKIVLDLKSESCLVSFVHRSYCVPVVLMVEPNSFHAPMILATPKMPRKRWKFGTNKKCFPMLFGPSANSNPM